METTPSISPAESKSPRLFLKLLILFAIVTCIAIFHFAESTSVKNVPQQNDARMRMELTTMLPSKVARSPSFSIEFLRKFYGKQASERTRQLDTITPSSNYATLYNVLVPEAYCPDIIRVGNVVDGGKWVCNPKAMPQSNCSLYSFGIREDISFDSEIQEFNHNRCYIHGYDADAQSQSTKDQYRRINGTIKQVRVGRMASNGETTVETLFQQNGDNYAEILKMDIEGAEHTSLVPFLDAYKTCQILLEVHGTAYDMRHLLKQIAGRGYLLFFYEVNGNSMGACEFSFIHKECLLRYGVFKLATYL